MSNKNATRLVSLMDKILDLSAYYREISKEPLLSREEEADLFLLLADQGLPLKEREAIRSRIIRANLRFPFKLAKKYSKGDQHTFEQLIAVGNEGLVVALEKFKPETGYRFLSYAGHWVLQKIWKEMSSFRIVSLPIYRQQLAARIQKFQLSHENYTFEDLKKAFPENTEKDLKELSETRYLSYAMEDVGDDPALEIDPIANEVEVRIDRERIHASIETIPSPHKEIIFLTYGMKDGRERTLTEISKELGISKDQLREYKKEAFEMLREKLADHSIDLD